MQNIINEPSQDISLPIGIFSVVACYVMLATVFISQMM